jgi:hypothetical protein
LEFFVEGNLLSIFDIQSLDHFYFENGRKTGAKMVKQKCLAQPVLSRTTSPARPPRRLAVPGPRAHAEALE